MLSFLINIFHGKNILWLLNLIFKLLRIKYCFSKQEKDFLKFSIPTTVVKLTHLNTMNTINVLLFTNQLLQHDSSNWSRNRSVPLEDHWGPRPHRGVYWCRAFWILPSFISVGWPQATSTICSRQSQDWNLEFYFPEFGKINNSKVSRSTWRMDLHQ